MNPPSSLMWSKPKITLSVNPVYYCNFSCSFCYLTPEQLRDKQLLDLGRFRELLEQVVESYEVTHVDIYGGEVLLLPHEYLMELKAILHDYSIDDIVLISNLSLVNEAALDEDFELGISYDFTAREKSELVFNNILSLPRWFNVLTLASRKFLDEVTPDEFVQTMNMLTRVNSVEIKPYSENQANQDRVSYKEFEEFVWAVTTHPDRRFYFENEALMIKSVEGTRNAYSDDHLYITPYGQFAVLDFDLNDREYFQTLSSVEEYRAWCDKEKKRVEANQFCSACEFKGRCLSEHLREVKSLENSCNGFHGLLTRWKNYEGAASSKARDNARLI